MNQVELKSVITCIYYIYKPQAKACLLCQKSGWIYMDLDTQWIDALWIYHKHKCIKYFFITLLYIQLQLPVSFTPLHTRTYKHTCWKQFFTKKIKTILYMSIIINRAGKKKSILNSNKTHNSYPKYTCNHSITHWYFL